MDEVDRSAMSMITGLQRGLETPSGMYGMPWRKRAAARATMLTILHARIRVDKGQQSAITADGDDYSITNIEYDSAVRGRAVERIRRWIQNPGHIDPVLTADLRVPRGFATAARRMGADPDAMYAIAVCCHNAVYEQNGAVLGLHHGIAGMTGTYRNGVVRWENDMVFVMTGTLPDVLSRSLAGAPLSRLVDDPIFGDRTVRRIETIHPKEGLARIELLRQVETKETKS